MILINLNRPRRIVSIALTWLASLRVRLIVTYVFVTVLSFVFLILQLTKPVEKYLTDRERDLMLGIASTLGSTISSPRESSEKSYKDDLRWTQRRCRLYLCRDVPGLRVRVVDPTGYVVVDSSTGIGWDEMYDTRLARAPIADRPEFVAR